MQSLMCVNVCSRMASIDHLAARAEGEGRNKRAFLEEIANAPDTLYSNSKVGEKNNALRLLRDMDKKEAGEHTSDIGEVRAQLQRLLQPPLFVGATPATPFRIATLVNNEIAEHQQIWNSDMLGAGDYYRKALERWFAEHPIDLFTPAARRGVFEECMQWQMRCSFNPYDPEPSKAHVNRVVRECMFRYDVMVWDLSDRSGPEPNALEGIRERRRLYEAESKAEQQRAHSPLLPALPPVAESKGAEQEDASSIASSTMRAVAALGVSPPAVTSDMQIVEQVVRTNTAQRALEEE